MIEAENSQNSKKRIQLVDQFESSLQSGRIPYFEEEDLCIIAEHYLIQSKLERMDIAINWGLKIHPNSPSLLICKAKLLTVQRQFNEALVLLERNIHLADDLQDALLLKSRILYELDRKDESFEILNYLINNEKDSKEDIYNDIAFIFSEMGVFDKAITFLKKQQLVYLLV